MKNIWLVTKREFLTNVKKRSFIIMTFLAPFLFVLAGAVISFMVKANKSTTQIGVVDHSQLFTQTLQSNDDLLYSFYNPADEKKLIDSLSTNETIDGLLVIPAIKDSTFQNIENHTQFYTNKNIGVEVQKRIESQLEKKIREEKLERLHITQEKIDKAKSKVVFTITNVKDGIKKSSNSVVNEIVSFVLLFFMYMFILVYGMRVMRGVMEEKSNRVIEIIISSLKPFDLMMGKIFGTTLVAFFQFLIWIMIIGAASFVLAGLFMPSAASFEMMQNNIPDDVNMAQMQKDFEPILKEFFQLNFPLILFTFLFYFVFGYIFYSAILAAIGAAVDSETETQQFMPVLLIPLMLGFYGSIFTFQNPDGPVAFWLSMIPITSPMAMLARIPYDVPWWQLALSMVLLIASVIGMVKIAARVYRIGILMYGKKTNFKEIWKWIKMGY